MRGMHGGSMEAAVGGTGMNRKDILNRVRMQVMLVRRLNGQIRELSGDGLRSLRLDGMPGRTRGVYHGLEVQIEKKEALERMLRRESRLMRQYEKEARKAMDGMTPELYAFSAMYYIAGFSVEETSKAMDRSVRQCMRYKREIETA